MISVRRFLLSLFFGGCAVDEVVCVEGDEVFCDVIIAIVVNIVVNMPIVRKKRKTIAITSKNFFHNESPGNCSLYKNVLYEAE